MGRSPLTRLSNRPMILRSSAYFEFYSFYIFQAFLLRFVSVVVFLRHPFLLSFYRFVCIGRDIYPKVHGCSPKCFVKYVIFHFFSCMLIAHDEKHHVEIMRRLRCGYSKSQIGTLQSHGQRKYLPFPYIKSYKKESEQS